MLVGNKKDLEAERQIPYEEGLNYAAKNGFLFMETSAVRQESVEAAIFELIREIKISRKSEGGGGGGRKEEKCLIA